VAQKLVKNDDVKFLFVLYKNHWKELSIEAMVVEILVRTNQHKPSKKSKHKYFMLTFTEEGGRIEKSYSSRAGRSSPSRRRSSYSNYSSASHFHPYERERKSYPNSSSSYYW
jgi:hypothetical protein